MKYDYRLIIIGGGSGGLSAADLAGQLGLKSVALVDKAESLGGECLHAGCVPSKALLHAAKTGSTNPWKHVHQAINTISDRSDNADHVSKQGIDVLNGEAKFIDNHTLQVGKRKVTARYFLVATGSSAAVPQIQGLEDVSFLTNETVFSLNKTPRSLIILGGGPIGCEMATAFSLLGTEVTLIQKDLQLLPREEVEAGNVIKQRLTDAGVAVLTNTFTTQVRVGPKNSTTVYYSQDGSVGSVTADQLLIALGRTPNIELDMEKAGIAYDKTGIKTNKYFQTSTPNIYAVGDCTQSPKFTHLAAHQAGVALRNILAPAIKKSGSYLQTVPWITFTQPEVGRIGLTEQEATSKKYAFSVSKLNLVDIDRAVTDDATDGWVSIITDPKGHILGATVVAQNASELLTPLAHAYYSQLPLQSLSSTVIPYPTMASGLNVLASRYAAQKARKSLSFTLISKLWR